MAPLYSLYSVPTELSELHYLSDVSNLNNVPNLRDTIFAFHRHLDLLDLLVSGIMPLSKFNEHLQMAVITSAGLCLMSSLRNLGLLLTMTWR